MTKLYKLDGDTKREYTDEEYAQAVIDEANYLQEVDKRAQAKIEAETKKAAAQAKLAALGLTTDDLTALGLGG